MVSISGSEEEDSIGSAMDALYCCCMCLGTEAQPSLVRLLIPSIQVSVCCVIMLVAATLCMVI